MKKYILISQGFPIYETIDKEEAVEYMETQNEEHYKWVEECINNHEPYDSSQEITMIEEDATDEDILRLFREGQTMTNMVYSGRFDIASVYLKTIRNHIIETQPKDYKDIVEYIRDIEYEIIDSKNWYMDVGQRCIKKLANKPKRDKERIKPFLQELEKYWLKDHDQRFGQLVYNLSRFHDLDQFNVEDNKLLEILQNLNRKGGVVVEVKHNGVD